jgi:hypothetical protein
MGGSALYALHEPSPSEAQSGSHDTQDKPVEHVRTAEGLTQAIPEDSQRDAAWRQADRRPDREVSELDPGCPQDHVDYGEGSDREKADGRNGEHTTARQPAAEPRQTRRREPLKSITAYSAAEEKGYHRTQHGSRERSEEASCRTENERCLEDEEGEWDHEQAAKGDTGTHNEWRQRPGCDGISPLGEAGR